MRKKLIIGAASLATLVFTLHTRPLAKSELEPVASAFRQSIPSRIAFTRTREDVDRPGSDYRLEAEIWMMNSDGSQAVRLTRNTTDDLGAVWSPDGKTIAFYGVQFAPDSRGQLTAGAPHIFMVDVGTGVQTQLLTDQREPVRGRFPSWSPDGQTIAFDTAGPGSNIAVINIDGTGLTQLTHDAAARNIRPDWSPDGRKIAFARGPAGNEQIFTMNADGSSVVRLTDPNAGGQGNAPDWSPDGRTIVFQSRRDSTAQPAHDQIYLMNADGSGQRRLTNHPRPDADPEWSPDGRMIAFDRRIEARNVDQVFVMSAEGGQAMPLTDLPSASGHAAWDRSGHKPAMPLAPEAVVIHSGELRLSGLLWKPAGSGSFPAVLFSHGAGRNPGRAHNIGPVFANHGYAFLYLFRRGHGPSAGHGAFIGDVLDREAAANGEDARRRLQVALLNTEQLDDVMAGLSFLKASADVDRERIAVAGHSFGGQLTLLAAERDTTVRAAVTFAAAAQAWEGSPELRERMFAAIPKLQAPVLLMHAANDFSTKPGQAMAAEMQRLSKPHQLKIYPAVGKTSADGHGAVYSDVTTWERDVFSFLDQHVRAARQ
jgi:carboxymethylenebutenolidase